MTIEAPMARSIGQLMCDTTHAILWTPARQWVRDQLPATTLLCRVGSGQATYHRFDPRLKQHQITYGKRMIMDKHRPDAVSGWLSGREIRQREYFGGTVTTLNLLAHTCCHEFAHLLQHVSGKRYHGARSTISISTGYWTNSTPAAALRLPGVISPPRPKRQGFHVPDEPIQAPDTRQLVAKIGR